jgi:predicted transcriptional regulator of viral defense system
MPGMREEMRSHRELAALVARQHGVVATDQLLGLGFSRSSITRQVAAGRLHRVHRGTYAVGHAEISPHGRCNAAVLACGAGTVLSHAAAAWLWGLLPACGPVVDVTVPHRGHGPHGVEAHHSLTIWRPERDLRDRIPTTAVPRTLLDLASRSGRRTLQSAIDRAERLDLLDLGEIDAMLERQKGARGMKRLRLDLEIYRDPAFTRARSERLFLDIVKKAGLPRPSLNHFVGGLEVDAYWERERFAVEIDGWSAHRTRTAFERDPVRQEELKLEGIDSIRVTARRIEREPARLGRHLKRILEGRRRERP